MKYSQSYIEELLDDIEDQYFHDIDNPRDINVTKAWISMVINEMPNKTQLGKQFDISPRSVGRIIERCIGDATVDYTEDLIAVAIQRVDEEVEDDDYGIDDDDDFEEDLPSIVSWSIGKKQISMITSDGDTIAVNESHPEFSEISLALISGNEEDAFALSNKKVAIQRWTRGDFVIDGHSVTYKGKAVGGEIIDYIVEMYDRGLEFEKFVKFFEKLMNNPAYRVVNQLFPFVQHTDIQINDDGDIVAWKAVTSDFKDFRTGRFDNSVGSVLEMPRNAVDEDPQQTCSAGLHLCARHYLGVAYGSTSYTQIIKCTVSPADVVAIPRDYNDSKMRCCRYKVIESV